MSSQGTSRIAEVVAQLLTEDIDVEGKLAVISELRENVEELTSACEAFVKSFTHVLETVSPQNTVNTQHKLRKSILEVINRVPHTEVLKAHVPRLAETLLHVAMNDNQENAIVAIRVVLDLLRIFKPELEQVANPLLKLFTQLYSGWDEMCDFYFNQMAMDEGMDGMGISPNMDMQPSQRSFKVIAECPIAVLHLLQLYGQEIRALVPPLIALMVKALSSEGSHDVHRNLHQAYKDMKYAQVKTVAFLSHCVKLAVHLMQPHEQEICDGLMNLLKTCPDECQWRRELIISTRTLLATEFRKTLDGRLNDLKDESAIIGKSRSCFEALRHYGYAVFAELAHQNRQNLTMEQLSWIVQRSCCIISDMERPAGSHTTAVQLLLHLVDVIYRQRFSPDGVLQEDRRELLQKILLCFCVRLSSVKKTKKVHNDMYSLLHNLFLGLKNVLYCLTSFNRSSNALPSHLSTTLTEQEIRIAVKMVKGGIESLKMCLRLKIQGNSTDLMSLFVEVFSALDPKDFVEIMAARISYLYNMLHIQMELHPIVSSLLEKQKNGVHLLSLLVGFLTENKLEVLSDPDHSEYLFLLKLFRVLFHALMKSEIHSLLAALDARVSVLISDLARIVRHCLHKIRSTSGSQGYIQLLVFLFKYLSRSRIQVAEIIIMMPPALDLFLSVLEGPDVGVPKHLLIELCLLLPLELEKKFPVLPKIMKPLLMALKGSDEMVLHAVGIMDEWIDRLNPVFLEPALSGYVQEINLALWSHLKPNQGSALGSRVLQLLGKLGGRNRRFLGDPLQLEWKDNPEHGLRLIFSFLPGTKFLVPLDTCIALMKNGLMASNGHKNNTNQNSASDNTPYYRQQGMRFLHSCVSAMMSLTDAETAMEKAPWTISDLKKLIIEGQVPLPTNLNFEQDPTLRIKAQFMAEKKTLITLLATVFSLCADNDLKEEATIFARGVCHYFAILFCAQASNSAMMSSSSSMLFHSGPEPLQSPLHDVINQLEPQVFVDAVIEVLTDEKTAISRSGGQAISWFFEMLLEVVKHRPLVSPEAAEHSILDITGISSLRADLHKPKSLVLDCGLPEVANALLHRILDCCSGDTWVVKSGGICGAEVLINEVPAALLRKNCPQFLRSLLHVMFQLPTHAVTYRTLLKELLSELIRKIVVLDPDDVKLGLGSDAIRDSQEINETVGKLCLTIFQLDVPDEVRDNCHEALRIVSNHLNKPLIEILDPFVTLQEKSLRRSLEDCIQISNKYKAHRALFPFCMPHLGGLCRLLIYCIKQELPSVPLLFKQIIQCADFAMIMFDICEEHPFSRSTGAGNKTRKNIECLTMKESALKMLVVIAGWDEFFSNAELPEKKKTLDSAVSIFFKVLMGPDESLRQIAKTGLSKLIEKKRISRYNFEEPIKPLLAKLSTFEDLDLNVLKGGAEALRLLSVWFNQKIGETFLDNLKRWLDHDQDPTNSQKQWLSAINTKIPAALLELFHVLPSSASCFLETQKTGNERIGLVVLTIELEGRLGQFLPSGPVPHVLWSPFRAPLTKFLVRYKEQSVSYFLAPTRMQNLSYVSWFIDILKSEIGEPLLQEVLKSTGQLMLLLQGNEAISESEASAMEIPVMASVHALYLIKTIVKLQPDWLPTQKCLYDTLCHIWRNIDMRDRVPREERMTHMELFECKSLAKCILNYISVHHEEVEALLSLLVAFEHTSKVSFNFVKEYCMEYVPQHYTQAEHHQLLLQLFRELDQQLPQAHSIFILRFLTIPILQSLKERGEMSQVVDQEIVQLFSRVTQNDQPDRDVCLDVEFLNVGKLLISGTSVHYSSDVVKGMFKYAWVLLKGDSIDCKSYAFLLIAYIFRAKYSLTSNLGIQVFVNVLRSDFAETKRELIQEALDVFVPTIAEIEKRESGEETFPTWITHCTKHITTEGHKLNLLMNLWQTVIGQPDLFYEYRSQFLGPMVNTLGRLRRPPINANVENRQMAIDMERVIVDWEYRRLNGNHQLQQEEELARVVSPPPLSEETFTNMKKMVVAFLAKTLFTLPPDHQEDNVKYNYRDIMGILSRALHTWSDVEVRLDFVERLIDNSIRQRQSPLPLVVAALDLVSLALRYQPETFLAMSWAHLLTLAKRVVCLRKEDLVDKLCDALEIVFALDLDSNPFQGTMESELLAKYLDISNQHMQANADFEISACLKILETDKLNRTGMIHRFLPPLVDLLERYSNEYSIIFQTSPPTTMLSANEGQRDTILLPNFGQYLYNVCKILELCGNRVEDQPIHKRERFAVAMMTFLSWKSGRVPDRAVFHAVMTIVSGWLRKIVSTGGCGLESNFLLWMMQQISRLDANGLVEPFMKKYFDQLFLSNIYEVCTAENVNEMLRREVLSHLEQTMLCGIRTATPELRKKFFALYKDALGNTLSERLKFILEIQDWEHVSSRFWLKQALDYMLVFLNGEEKISFPPNSAQLMPFPFQEASLTGPSNLQQIDLMEIDEEKTKFDLLLEELAIFLNKTKNFRAKDVVEPLREYAHIDSVLACHLWVLIFPIVWAALEKENHHHLAKSFISLLLKPYHINQANQRPNVIQGLLEGASLSQPQPRIPSDLIKYLGKTYNAWHIAIPLLECHVMLFPDETRYFDTLNELYNLVSETDMMFGLMKKRFSSTYTRAGISLMQYGYWEEALHIFGEATVQSTTGRVDASTREVLLWSEEWCRCAKELNLWEELHEWADSTENMAMLADAAWRLPDPDWGGLRQILQNYKEQIPDALQYSMLMVYSASQDNNTALCNTHINQAMELCLQRWWQLPEIGILAQANLLRKFQQVVELCESSRAFLELGNGRNGRHEHTNFTKDILETWRLRTPNDWEPFSVWSDVFIWRHIIYSSIANSIAALDPAASSLHHLCVKNKAWSINRLASVARKHGALDLCIDIETNMYNDSYMDIHEAYLKIVEQSKAYLLMENHKMTGLNMLCSTNLDYFPYQVLHAEIFRLQGELYRAMNNPDMASRSYSTSITLNVQKPESWLCWGAFCDEIYEKNKMDPNGTVHLEYAIGCYFQSMSLNSAAARAMIPRCLHLLSFDKTGTVEQAFKNAVGNAMDGSFPVWNWLFYIPQMLSIFHRPEGEALKPMLHRILSHFPQALFYYLRVHMLNAKESLGIALKHMNQRHRAEASNPSTPHGHNEVGSGSLNPNPIPGSNPMRDDHMLAAQNTLKTNFENVKELLDRLKLQMSPNVNAIEVMLREFASSFNTRAEERLMAVVHALLGRCYKVPGAPSMHVPQNLIREIEGVCDACFLETRSSAPLLRQLKDSFVRQLSPTSDVFPSTLGALTDQLKSWRNKLTRYFEDQIPNKLQLHRESPTLHDLTISGIEMPCHYSKDPDKLPESPIYLEKIGSEVEIVRRQNTTIRRFTFYDSEGRKTYFILQHGPTAGQPMSSGERMFQFMRLLNRLLNKHHQSRNRFLNFFTPLVIPVWNKVRLVEEDPSFTSFLEPLEINSSKYSRETEHPILLFKCKVYGGKGDMKKLCFQALVELTKLVSENVFSQYMYKILPSSNHLWVFKKQFCSQMALSSLMSVMLTIGGRVPGKILFSRSSGRVNQIDFFPNLNADGLMLKNEEAVPFRLTGNLSAFFTAFGVEGCFMTTMVVAAMAFLQRHSNLEPCLSIFLRDELLAWAYKKEVRSLHISNVDDFQSIVTKNTLAALNHVKSLCPIVPKVPDETQPQAIDQVVRDLVESATQLSNLCAMEPTWHPWY